MLNFLKNRYIMVNKKSSMMNTGIIIPDFTVIDCIIVLGFKLSNATFRCLVLRFANQEGNIEFDDFVLCAVRLKSMYGRCWNYSSHTAWVLIPDVWNNLPPCLSQLIMTFEVKVTVLLNILSSFLIIWDLTFQTF